MNKVVVIEEEEKTLAAIDRMQRDLLDSGFLIVGRADAAHAVSVAAHLRPDLAVLNSDLFDTKVCCVVTELRCFLPDLSVVFLTGERRFETVQDAVRVGAGVLAKPFRTEELTKALSVAADRKPPHAIPEIERYAGQNNLLRKALVYLAANYYKHINQKIIAEALQVTPSHLSRTFHAALGFGVGDVLGEVRLWYAKQLLETTGLPMYEIADRVGFSETAYFNSCFKGKTGLTPNEYRREYQTGRLANIM